jgi:adenylate cyclase
MTENADHRKLAAILCADVKGYSKLMGEDESYTVGALKERRKLFADNIQTHGGRVVNAPGDSILAEFPSVVSAVQCAVEIQNQLNDRNADLPDNRKMAFRIGVNLGDVIESEGAIYGDGVNIAARIEGLAEPGGVSISRTVFDHVQKKLRYGYEYQGEHQVKNITNPVKVFKLLTAPEDAGKLVGMEPRVAASKWIWPTVVVAAIVVTLICYQLYQEIAGPIFEPASVEEMAYELPDKPSIAVLPFDNMSKDPKQEYLSDSITDQIINTLSRFPRLFVIDRGSTFFYKEKNVKIKKVSEELGVRYVLEGGVQKAGEKVRVTAQLIDAIAGHHVWSERYDLDAKDIFALQDKIAISILNAMSIELTEGEQAHRWTKKGVTNLKALEMHYQGLAFFLRGTKEDYYKAIELFEEAIALDPNFTWPYVYSGLVNFTAAVTRLSDSPAKSLQIADELADKALAIDDSDDGALSLKARIYTQKRQYDKALHEVERAVSINPNGADAYHAFASIMGQMSRWDESLLYAKKAIRLSPYPGPWYYLVLGRAYFMTRQYEESIAALKKMMQQAPNNYIVHVYLAACYSSLGRDAEATAETKEVLRINPKFSVESFAKGFHYKNTADSEKLVAALKKAGLPETQPLPIPDKPSIAVLPFDNLSGDPEQEYFSDGITEDIITALSKTPKMLVIARNSTFTYKGKPVKVQQVANELGVRYVLEGSVRKVEERVRITAQLVDAKSGHHLWAEKYDRDLEDIFALQDEITKEIITALQVNLTEGEQARIRAKGANNLEAYLKTLEARELVMRWNIEDNYKARQLFNEALKLDPNYAITYCGLVITHIMDLWIGSTESKKDSITKAKELIKKALSLDNYSGQAFRLLGNIHYFENQYDEGILELEKAVELEPNGADAFASLARGLDLVGRTEEAIQMSNKAMRLNPIPPDWYIVTRTAMYRNIQNYDEALIWAKKAVERAPNNFFAHINLCSVYSLLGQMEEARLEAEEVIKLNPKFSLKKYENTIPYKIPLVKKQYIDALRNAGIPD